MASTVFIGLVIGLISYYLYFKFMWKSRKCIPGPLGIPVLGILPFLRKDAYRHLHEMSNKYGKIFELKVGTKTVVVISDWKSINEALNNQRKIFSGRPELFTIKALAGGIGNRQLTRYS